MTIVKQQVVKQKTTATLIALMLAGSSAFAAPPASAVTHPDAEPPTYDGTRAGITLSHGIAGALLGGPLGYAAGVLAGTWVSNKVIDGYENEASLEQAAASLASLESANHRLETRLARAGHEVDELQRLAADSLQLQVLFRTGNDELEVDSTQRIEQLAQFLQQQPGLRVHLSGYADPRGDASYNDTLSAGRVGRVATLLEQQGVAAERITTAAHGESQSRAAKDDLDSYALERRVDIELLPPADDMSLADAR